MSEVISKWIETKDISIIEDTQQKILDSYELDFAKHAPVTDIPKLSLIWKSVPERLAKENSKFIFSHVKKGARAKDLEDALQWLTSAGMVYKVQHIKKPFIPLSAYSDSTSFKLYMADVGLLRRMAKLPADAIYHDLSIFKEFKGALVENFVLQEIVNLKGDIPYYWTSGNKAEIDFISQFNTKIISFEVKAGKNLRSRSLSVYKNKYKPEIAVKTSLEKLKLKESIKYIPLYLLWKINDYIC